LGGLGSGKRALGNFRDPDLKVKCCKSTSFLVKEERTKMLGITGYWILKAGFILKNS
jgi:hypothetical protein